MKELQRRGDPNVVIALAGNKADMDSKRKVNVEEAQQYAQDNEIIFLETSAKTALNVRNLFLEIGKAPASFTFFCCCLTYTICILISISISPHLDLRSAKAP